MSTFSTVIRPFMKKQHEVFAFPAPAVPCQRGVISAGPLKANLPLNDGLARSDSSQAFSNVLCSFRASQVKRRSYARNDNFATTENTGID